MGNISEQVSFDAAVYQIETTDPLLGGAAPTGVLNKAAQALANRTQWLNNALRGYDNFTFTNANKSLTLADVLLKLVVINANSASLAYILPVLTTADFGVVVSILSYNVTKQVTINSAGTNDIQIGSELRQKLFLGNGDAIKLVWTGIEWLLIEFTGNFTEVGIPFYGYYQHDNTLIAQGQLVSRADYPRLWEWANAKLGGSLIDDTTWLIIPGSKGFFSTGDGSSTFRLPDLRAMFIRGLDLSAGVDLGRASNNPGDYEADELKAHNHTISTTSSGISNNDGADPARGSIGGSINSKGSSGTGKTIGTTGGLETRPKNIGLLPLIKV